MKTGWKTAVVVMAVLAAGGWAGHRGPGRRAGMGSRTRSWSRAGYGAGHGNGDGHGPDASGNGADGTGAWAGPMGPAHSNALGAIGAWLNLTDEQKTQIREIQEQGKADAEAAQEAVADARDALHDAVIGGAAETEIRAAATALGGAIGNQAVLHAKTVAAAKAVLTDEQRKKFDEMRAKLPGLRQRIPHAPGPFCPWADPNDPNQVVQAPMRGQGFGGGPVPTEQIFKAADTNKDGKLTLEELEAFHNKVRGGGLQFRHQQ